MIYTVGAQTSPDEWFVRMPWNMRGSWAEVADQAYLDRARLPAGCAGIEYWDGHVQFQRHRWPWLEEVKGTEDV